MANAGFERESLGTCRLFVRHFRSFDYIVSPSASCVHHVRAHYDALEQDEDVRRVREQTYELSEFLVRVLRVENLDAGFAGRVGLHQGCQGLRGLRLGASSEMAGTSPSCAEVLLRKVKGLQLVGLDRRDECCGFGGTFATSEEAVSVKMGSDRIQDHLRHGAEVITATDMSCLMHLEGIIRRRDLPVRVMHIAEILNSSTLGPR
jgi:L-lactate dehydrogenase complex protein LldE